MIGPEKRTCSGRMCSSCNRLPKMPTISGVRSSTRSGLLNSPDPDAAALRSAKGNGSIPWRLFYRVTYSERFLPPISTGLNGDTADHADHGGAGPQSRNRLPLPADDVQGRAAGKESRQRHRGEHRARPPTQSGLSVGTIPTSGLGQGLPVQPNNVIPFDLLKNASTIVNWGDSNNAKATDTLHHLGARHQPRPDVAERAAGVDAGHASR